jgi:hypothetical protein
VTSALRDFSKAIVAAVGLATLLYPQSSAAHEARVDRQFEVEAEAQLRLCLDEQNKTKPIVDLLLLLDNSTSLNQAKFNKPTDPYETRFVAIEGMLNAIGRAIKGTKASVNFGLVTFADYAEVRIPLGEEIVSESTASSVAARVRNEAPSKGQRNGTNFIKALDAALNVFNNDSPPDHCRVLVWFTDGMFAHGGSTKDTERELGKLPSLACGPGGFAKQIRDLKINPFVILLKPSDMAQPNTKSLSYELMQQVTGDRTMPAGFEVTNPSSVCSQILPTVGEVYDADNAAALAPYFVDIGRAVSGGQAIDDCPIPAGDASGYRSPPLPAPRFLSWISIVFLKSDPPSSLEGLNVSTASGAQPLLSHFEVVRSDSDLLLSPISSSQLEKGWLLVAQDGLDGACLRAKLIEPLAVAVSKKGAEPATVRPDPGTPRSYLLTDSDLEAIAYFDGKTKITIEDLFSTDVSPSKITATLDVDPSKKIARDGLQINVTGFSTEPQVADCVANGVQVPVSELPRVGELERGKDRHEFGSTTCSVDLRFSKKELFVDASSILSSVGAGATGEGSEECRSPEAKLVIDGVKQDGLTSTLSEDKEYLIGIQLSVGNKAFSCEVAGDFDLSFVGLGGTQETLQAPVRISLRRVVPPNPLTAIIVSLAAVAAAALLSLLLLKVLNTAMTSLPDDSKLYGFEIPIEVGVRGTGQVVALHKSTEVSKIVPQAGDLRPPKGDKNEISVHTLKLRRRVPGLFRPFREPRAEVVNETGVVYRQRTSQGGLAVPFRQALVLRPSREAAKDLELTSAILTLLVPRSGNGSGMDGVARLLRGQSLNEATREFLDSRRSSTSPEQESGGSSPSEPAPRSPAGPSGKAAPQPPNPPVPPPKPVGPPPKRQ